MKLALIGASGYVGSALLAEAVRRELQVTAVVQHPEKIAAQQGVSAVKVDVNDTQALAAVLLSHDAVISAFSGHAQSDVEDYYLTGFRSIMQAVKQAAVPRFLVVGGAGSLEVSPGVQLVDTPQFPAQWKGTAEGARKALNLLREEASLDWVMLSPAAHLDPGARTGVFRIGGDQLLVDENGNSHISTADFAVAMFDELASPKHSRKRFSVAY